ncbi:MAG: hypothetical protein IJX30_00560 [Clostridia bacterium]|nr:hypothetical protein [Clostridia bacterium]
MAVKKITDQEKQNIINASVQNMQSRKHGSAAEMQKALVSPIVNTTDQPSLDKVVDRVIADVNSDLRTIPLLLVTALTPIDRKQIGETDTLTTMDFNRPPVVGETFSTSSYSVGGKGFVCQAKVTKVVGTTVYFTYTKIVESQCDSGVTIPVDGFFSLAVDANGDLWSYSANDTPYNFEYDEETGNLYLLQAVDYKEEDSAGDGELIADLTMSDVRAYVEDVVEPINESLETIPLQPKYVIDFDVAPATVGSTGGIPIYNFNRPPKVGESFQIHGRKGNDIYLLVCNCEIVEHDKVFYRITTSILCRNAQAEEAIPLVANVQMGSNVPLTLGAVLTTSRMFFNREPIVGERFNIHVTENATGDVYSLTGQILSVNSNVIANGITYKVVYLTNVKDSSKMRELDNSIAALVEEISKIESHKIVTALPETGEPNKFYLVPKTSDSTDDSYDEYLWINNKWEFLGTKKFEVTLEDYVKKTEYAGPDKAGVFKTADMMGIAVNFNTGVAYIVPASAAQIDGKTTSRLPITPENGDYFLRKGVTTNTETLTDEEKTAACNWLGALNKPSGAGILSYDKDKNTVSTRSTYQGVPGNGQIPVAKNTGCITTNDPIDNLDCVNKQFLINLPDKVVLTEDSIAEDGTVIPGLKTKWLEMLGALQRETTVGNGSRVYGKDNNGYQRTWPMNSATPLAGWLIAWHNGGVLRMNDPIAELDGVNKQYLLNLPDKVTFTDEEQAEWRSEIFGFKYYLHKVNLVSDLSEPNLNEAYFTVLSKREEPYTNMTDLLWDNTIIFISRLRGTVIVNSLKSVELSGFDGESVSIGGVQGRYYFYSDSTELL